MFSPVFVADIVRTKDYIMVTVVCLLTLYLVSVFFVGVAFKSLTCKHIRAKRNTGTIFAVTIQYS